MSSYKEEGTSLRERHPDHFVSIELASPVDVPDPRTPIVSEILSEEQDVIPDAIRNMTTFKIFLKFLGFGFRAWGGPLAQIALIKHQLVDVERWITTARFYKVLAVYQALPGPEATELCCYFGMVAGGRLGAVAAGLGFLLPGLALMLLCCWLYDMYGFDSEYVAASFRSMTAVVTAMVFRAAHRMSESAITKPLHVALAIFSCLEFVLRINFFITLFHAGITSHLWPSPSPSPSPSSLSRSSPTAVDSSYVSSSSSTPHLSGRMVPDNSVGSSSNNTIGKIEANDTSTKSSTLPTLPSEPDSRASDSTDSSSFSSFRAYLPVIIINMLLLIAFVTYCAVAGKLPSPEFISAGFTVGGKSLASLFLLSLMAGLLTFGGAYTAIPLVRQSAVVMGAWMTAAQFTDAIAIASLLPAPLVLFTTFVGFVGGGFPGALICTVGVFLPAFSFTLIGHHFFERLVNSGRLTAFLDGITASVIGLMFLSGWQLVRSSLLDPPAVVIFIVSLAILYHVKHTATASLVILSAAIIGQILYAPDAAS